MDNTTEFCYNLLKPNGRIKEICQDEPIIDESTITNDGFDGTIEFQNDGNVEWYIDGQPIDGDPTYGYDLSVDKPWYQDVWDFFAELAQAFWSTYPVLHAIAALLAIALVAGFVWWLIDRARWVDLADDNYDVEDYIDELNQNAAQRGGSAEYSDSDDQYAMG